MHVPTQPASTREIPLREIPGSTSASSLGVYTAKGEVVKILCYLWVGGVAWDT